jgi:acyl carrier protein
MDKNSVAFQLLEEAFVEKPSIIDLSVKLEDLDGWDSLTAMMLIDLTKQRSGLDLDIENIGEMTVVDFSKLFI